MNCNKPIKRLGRFINPYRKDLKRGVWDVILWFCGFYKDSRREEKPPEGFSYPLRLSPIEELAPSVVWVGHSTFVVQVGGLHFLTDPVFSSYCSPVPISGLKRLEPPAITIKDLPRLDCVLVSHNHYDHLSEESVLELHQKQPELLWIVPLGLKPWFVKRGILHVRELNWGESTQYKDAIVTAVPSQHFSGRGLFDKNRTLWCGFVVQHAQKTFYFVGDTGYNSVQFKEIGKNWPVIDLSLIPIGTYVPKEFMAPVHISPDEAVQIHKDVGSRLSVGMHWNTFVLSEEDRLMPPYDLFRSMQAQKIPFETFLPLKQGVKINW